MSFSSLLDNSMDIKRESLTADGMGGYTKAYAVLYTNVKCRFETTSRKTEILALGGKADVYPDYIVYMEYRSGIKEGDHIIYHSRTFEIKLVGDWSERGKYMPLEVVELKRMTA